MTPTEFHQPGAALDRDPPGLAGEYNREWRRRYHEGAAAAPAEWAADPRLREFARATDALAALDGDPDRAEAVLGALLGQSAQGDETAARVIIQHLLPFLLWRAAHRSTFPHPSRRDALDDLVSTAWEVARTGLTQHTRSLRDALPNAVEWRALGKAKRQACLRARREFPAAELRHPSRQPLVQAGPPSAVEVVGVLADAMRAGAITRDEARLLGSISVGARNGRPIAAACRSKPGPSARDRVAALGRLARWAAEQAGDAETPPEGAA